MDKQAAYHEYINSAEWKEKAEARKQIDGCKCAVCGSTQRLNVHHWTYRNFGHEDIDKDLVTLCEYCHIHVLHRMKDECLEYSTKLQEEMCDDIRRYIATRLKRYRTAMTDFTASRFADFFGTYKISGGGKYYEIVRGIETMLSGLKAKRSSEWVNYDALFQNTVSYLGRKISEFRKKKGYR